MFGNFFQSFRREKETSNVSSKWNGKEIYAFHCINDSQEEKRKAGISREVKMETTRNYKRIQYKTGVSVHFWNFSAICVDAVKRVWYFFYRPLLYNNMGNAKRIQVRHKYLKNIYMHVYAWEKENMSHINDEEISLFNVHLLESVLKYCFGP